MKYLWLLALAVTPIAHADIITEFGMGYKLGNTSYLLMPACQEALVIRPEWPANPRGLTDTYSCGGDNPAFIGWPIAWEADRGVYRYRLGWFHYSNWFDGGELMFWNGDERETSMNALAGSITFNWTKWRAQRRSKR